MSKISWILTFVSVVNFVHARTGRLSPEAPNGYENHNLEIKVIDLKPPIKVCQISLQNPKEKEPAYIINKETQFEDVHFIGNESIGECGILLSPAKNSHKGVWSFFVQDGDGVARKFMAPVKLQSLPPEPVSKHIRKSIGYPLEEPCYSQMHLITYVKIYNPNNELVQEGPSKSLTLNPLKPEHNGTWKCVLQLKGRLTEAHNSIVIEVMPNESYDILKTETDTHVNLLYKSLFSTIPACVFERPDEVGFSMIEGIRYERYSYYGSGIKNGDCGLSIEKPLQDHDIGIWKCFLPPKKLGGFVHVYKKSSDNITSITDIPVGTTTPVIKALEGNETNIQCHAKESLAYCYVKSPKGTIYWSAGDGLLIGQCKVKIKVEQSDNGTWICGMGVQGYTAGYEDLQVPINVFVYESPLIISKEPQAPVSIGKSTEIACRTALGDGVKYCIFKRPDGTHINIGSITQNPYGNSSYTYKGEGLEKGYCGLLIDPVREKDIGNWTCRAGIASFQNKAPEYGIIIKVTTWEIKIKVTWTMGVGSKTKL